MAVLPRSARTKRYFRVFARNDALQREGDMTFTSIRNVTRLASAAAAFVLSLALTLGAAQAQDKTYVMKIGTPTVNDAPDQFATALPQTVEKDSGGRIKSEVYSASKLGSMPRQIEGMQFGSIECAIIPPEFFVGVDERFEVMATPGPRRFARARAAPRRAIRR